MNPRPIPRWALVGAGIFLAASTAFWALSENGLWRTRPMQATQAAPAHAFGIVFSCDAQARGRLRPAVDAYLESAGVAPAWVRSYADDASGKLVYAASPNERWSSSLDLIHQSDLALNEEALRLPTGAGQWRTVRTVSRKEILLAMLLPGRSTVFAGQACDVQALIDHVGVRQNTAAWAEDLAWGWPDGGAARMPARHWGPGKPGTSASLRLAVQDAFIHQRAYAIGSYTATKLLMVQGVLDYHDRVKHDAMAAQRIEAHLLQDGAPLGQIEPGAMWSFATGSTPQQRAQPGKLLALQQGIDARNHIPGDWSYIVNTDAPSARRTGYEGANAVYLGRGKFADFYAQNRHAYSHEEQLHKVYQWRNGVFDEARDLARTRPIHAIDLERLERTPASGGVLLNARLVPLTRQ